jgi:hypothetical protein
MNFPPFLSKSSGIFRRSRKIPLQARYGLWVKLSDRVNFRSLNPRDKLTRKRDEMGQHR